MVMKCDATCAEVPENMCEIIETGIGKGTMHQANPYDGEREGRYEGRMEGRKEGSKKEERRKEGRKE